MGVKFKVFLGTNSSFFFFFVFNFVLLLFLPKKQQLFNWTDKKLEWNFVPFISPPFVLRNIPFLLFLRIKHFLFSVLLFYFSNVNAILLSIKLKLNLFHCLIDSMECFKLIGNFIPPIQLQYCILKKLFYKWNVESRNSYWKNISNFTIQIIPDISFLHDRTCVMSHRPTFCYLLFVVAFVFVFVVVVVVCVLVVVVAVCEVLTSWDSKSPKNWRKKVFELTNCL